MEKEIICTVCPMGCHITVTGEGDGWIRSLDIHVSVERSTGSRNLHIR